MIIKPKISSYEYELKTIDSHTMGEPTRIVYDGFPELPGENMMEKKKYLISHYDDLRRALMLEPRGHRDMFGALLTEPIHKEADFGVIFMDSGGCLNMCGHGSIGAASMIVETQMVETREPYTEVVLDAPSGLIRAQVLVEHGKAQKVSILNVPAFLYKQDLKMDVPGYGMITYDISFGGSFFALVDAEQIGLELSLENVEEITELGMLLRKRINETVEIKHPYLDITTVDLVEFYAHTDTPEADMKNCVIFGDAQVDRSPCGTGTSAKMAALYAKGKLKPHEPFVYESITGSMFVGEVYKEVEVSGRKGIIPKITGSAYITGCNTWILDKEDPLEKGFLVGAKKEAPKESTRSLIVRAAWQLFQKKGYEQVTIEDVIAQAGVTEEIFHQYFSEKDDLENTLGELFDRKYADLMIEMSPRMNHYEMLLQLNTELFTLIENDVPFDLVRHLYMDTEHKKPDLLDKKRFYYQLIPKIIEEGLRKGEFQSPETAESLADTYASLERGIIYDWCVKNGEEDLVQKGHKMLSIFLKQLLA